MTASAKPGKGDYGPSVTAMGFYPIPDFLVAAESPESFDKGIDYNNKRDDTESEWTKEYQGATGEERDEPEQPIGKDEDTPQNSELKTATPMLMVKVVGTNGAMSLMQVLKAATDNGYSEDSVINALEQAVAEGEIEKNGEGKYILAEE